MARKINLKLSFLGRLELFCLNWKMRKEYEITYGKYDLFKEIKEMFFPPKLGAIFG